MNFEARPDPELAAPPAPGPPAAREWPRHGVSFRDACKTWAYIASLSFGGPAAQIAVMHRVVVDEKRWIGEQRFLHALNFCMLLPGPEAMQLATYIGWLMHRTRGALVAGLLFILPGFIAIMALSMVYAVYHQSPIVDALFFGIRPAVLAIVLQAVVRIGSRSLPNRAMVAVAACSFVAIFFFGVPFPAIIGGAILLGLIGSSVWPGVFKAGKGHGKSPAHALLGPPLLADDALLPVSRSPVRAARVLVVWLVIWFTPLLAAGWLFGTESTLYETGVFFSKAAVVTFGGAYAVLGYVAQHAPEVGWLMPGEMLDGLGMAETTPGPLIMVLQFVGFLACYREPPGAFGDSMLVLHPLWSGVLGGTLATWVTFAPCFMWILLGAPYMEQLRHNKRLGAALACVTAAVVGVVLSLAIWFAINTTFGVVRPMRVGPWLSIQVPDPTTFSLGAAGIAVLALYLVFRLKWGIFRVILTCAVAGILVSVGRMFMGWNPD